MYMLERKGEGSRERENSIYIFIVRHALQLMSKDVERC